MKIFGGGACFGQIYSAFSKYILCSLVKIRTCSYNDFKQICSSASTRKIKINTDSIMWTAGPVYRYDMRYRYVIQKSSNDKVSNTGPKVP